MWELLARGGGIGSQLWRNRFPGDGGTASPEEAGHLRTCQHFLSTLDEHFKTPFKILEALRNHSEASFKHTVDTFSTFKLLQPPFEYR